MWKRSSFSGSSVESSRRLTDEAWLAICRQMARQEVSRVNMATRSPRSTLTLAIWVMREDLPVEVLAPTTTYSCIWIGEA